MLQARAHLQSASSQALRRPAAAGCSTWSAFSTLSTRAGALGRAQRRWEEPQVARLQWSIVQLPIGPMELAGPRSWPGARRHASTVVARPPPQLEPTPTSALPPEGGRLPPRPLPPSSAPVTPPPPLAASIPPRSPPRAAQGDLRSPASSAPGYARPTPPPHTAAALELSLAVELPPPSIKLGDHNIVSATDADSRQPVPLPSPSPEPQASSTPRPAVHPASFFGPQAGQLPIRISSPPQLSPVVSLHSLMPHPAMPWAGAQKWAAKPGDALAEIRSVGDFVIEPRAAQGRWLSRNVVSAHGREPETLDGLDFRPAKRHPVAAEPMDAVDGAGFGLSPTRTSDAASTANKIVNEAMEVMSYAALPAPYLRPDAELPSADRSSAEQKFTSEITRRYTDQAIRVHCIAFRLEEAFELFTHAYPGWVPWGPPSVRPRPSAAEVDERVLYSLSLGLVKTGSSARAELFLKHVETLFDDIPSAAYYFARMRVDMGLKRFDAAQAWYKKMADHPAKPLEDRHFVTRVIQTLMRIGQLTKNPKLSLYWLDVAHERHGLEPHLGSLRELLDSFAVVGDSSAVAKVWNLAQTIPVHSPATRKIYTDMLERCIWLYATPGSGTSYRQISYFVGKAIASGKLLPSPNTFATVMRAAAEEENYDAARDIMRTMESGEFGGEAFPAACKHYEQLLLALDRQLPHAGKATLDAVLKDDVAQERPSIGDRDAARILDRQTVARVLERALDLVDEMKERDIPLSGTIMSRLTRMLAFNATTRSEGIRLAMSALASLPRPDEGWSAYNQWAMPRGIGSFKGRASTATLVFTTLIKALSHTGEAENYNTALQAYDHFLQLRGSEELSVVDAAGILAIAGKADQTQYIERVWELSIKRAVDSKAVFDLPKGNEPGPSRPGELRSDGSDSFLANLHIALPDPSQAEPFVEQLSPAVQTLLRVVNQHITPASLLYLENEWLRVYRLGFGFDVGCWCELARAYLGAGRYERGFQIINDVVLFRHNQLLADFERAHGGSTVPDAPPFANEQAASTGLLSDEIQRAPPHYQDMVAKSYSLPLVPKGQMLHHQVMIKSLAQCGRTYGRSVGTVGPSMAYSKVAQDRRLLEEVFRALSWAPTGIIDALEEAQRMIRAEAVREWHEDTPELSGENPLQRAERFFANYPRVAQLLAIRQARQATDAPGVTRGWTI